MTYKVEVVAGKSGVWAGNQLTFKTRKEAEDYAKGLASRWTAVRAVRVCTTDGCLVAIMHF